MKKKKIDVKSFDAGVRASIEVIDSLLATYWARDEFQTNRKPTMIKNSLSFLLHKESLLRKAALRK